MIALDEPAHRQVRGEWQPLSLPLRRQELYRCLSSAVGEGDAYKRDDENLDSATGPDRSLHLLLVEDNRVNQIVASGILKKLGYRVDLAENGERALGAIARTHYDAVLMDCQMPVMNGYEATRRIRENPEWQDLPVIAVTANVMQGDKDDCLAAGMNDYITKPYDKHDLKTVIERWSNQRPQDD